MPRPVPRPIRALRLALLALHLATGLATIVLRFPFAIAATRFYYQNESFMRTVD